MSNFSLINLFYKKGLFKNLHNAGLYFLGSIIQSILALFTQPIYSLHLTANEFGIIGYFDAIKSLFAPIFIFSISSVYLMKYFKQSEDENKKLLFNLTFYLCCFNTIVIFICYGILYLYFRYMNVNIPLTPFAWFILVALLLDNIKSIVLINFRIRKKALNFLLYSALNSVLNVGIGLLLVVQFNLGAEGRMAAPILSIIILLPVSIVVLKKYTTIYFNFKEFINATKTALPLVLAAYAFVPISNIDRLFLERLQNLSELGLYNIGITIAGYIQLAYVALALAYEPDIFKSVSELNYKRLFYVAVIMFLPYFLFVIIFMNFSGDIISILTSGRYVAAQQYTNVALISVFLMGIYWFFDKIFIALEKTRLNLYVNIIGGLSAIIIMYIAVKSYEYIGAAYAKIFIAVIMVSISSILAIKQLKLKKTIN